MYSMTDRGVEGWSQLVYELEPLVPELSDNFSDKSFFKMDYVHVLWE